MAQTSYSTNDYDVFVGIDVDKKSFSFTARDRHVIFCRKTIPSDTKNFHGYITKKFNGKRLLCGYEAGPTGFHLYDYLKEKGVSCLITPPTSIPKAPNERVKTNKIDSEKIADYLQSGQLKSIRVPEGCYRELRQFITIREHYADNGMKIKQKIGALMLSNNLYSNFKDTKLKWSIRDIRTLKELECTESVRNSLNMLLMDLEYIRKQTSMLYRTLKTFCNNNEEIKKYLSYLQSIPGIGFITAATLLGRIGDPKNLRNVRELGGFLGLVPSEDSTGERVVKGHITHSGNNKLRSLLVEAAWTAIRYDKQLAQFYHRIRVKNHPSIGPRKAIVAVARKLTLIIYKILKEQREFIAI